MGMIPSEGTRVEDFARCAKVVYHPLDVIRVVGRVLGSEVANRDIFDEIVD